MKVIVVGGGAAGFFGAIACAEVNPRIEVTLIEAGRKPLAKVRISGGGRCNVTHHCFDPARLVEHYPRGGKALRGAFTRFQPKDTVQWYQKRGVKLKTEADGRMFPITDDSQTIINCLMEAADKAGVDLRTGVGVKSVKQFLDKDNQSYFQVELKNERILQCDRILIATGSNPLGYRWAKNLGHNIEPAVPSLFTFNIKDNRLKDLAGVSVSNARIRLGTGKNKLEQNGALLITHWGLSGPGILKLSAWGARFLHELKYASNLEINWLPEYNQETLKQNFLEVKETYSKKKIINYCPVKLPKRLWQRFIDYAAIKPDKIWSEISKKELNKLVTEIVRGEYQIQGKGVFKDEFVTCGGISLKEVNFKTMESKKCPGLYFAGEVLDIDGVTGGFNFQSAWTTSWLAGNAIANSK
ncbi:NAD(P)/FAD-dependent oxidoreductase [Waterburya agarophytonicola K14]|uniref:NAD(P)/FAD-dependent oxidoreductase n=1 Tax=Waterburya agarophytonicola KI4 TaxID=2874699 RepID=A0A964BUL3_9CYAN|nr:NAD(P)/FAD-dependent oxidoreductase [Waterburya agarophytonicola]MCC0178972.1 NAD(P)/FAD-dependent oxidoreductase [Waterburya agarophytonicola KI4]